MPSASNQAGTAASVVLAILGLFFFTKKVARAKALGALSAPPTSSSSSSSSSRNGRGGGGGGGGDRGGHSKVAFAVGLLDIALPRDDRPGGSFPRVMVNDACITRAVQEVSRKLVVSLRDVGNVPAGVIRAYVSELYQEVYDAANAAHRPDLDVRILLPEAGASCGGSGSSSRKSSGSGSSGGGSSSSSSSRFRASNGVNNHASNGVSTTTTTTTTMASIASASTAAAAATAAATEHPLWTAAWATREVAELEPDLEVLFSDEFRENDTTFDSNDNGGGSGGGGGGASGSNRQSTLNVDRARAGFPPLVMVSLEAVAKRAYTADYFYAENVLAEIPAYSSVACGGTFDRLHGGHKKLLTLAASLCADGTLTVGVTSDSMLKKKSNASMVASLPERLEGVKDFLR
ncbi:unnamed protein product, partial [Laminaria digitata]